MAEENRSLLSGGPADALGDGAARFDRMIEAVKTSQAAPAAEAPAPPAPSPLLSTSPHEEWSRRFRSEGIGPEIRAFSPADLAPVPRALVMPDLAVPHLSTEFAAPRAADIVQAEAIVPRKATEGLGEQIGKAEKPRRSWLGRVFQRAT